jgi:hypothetical protein
MILNIAVPGLINCDGSPRRAPIVATSDFRMSGNAVLRLDLEPGTTTLTERDRARPP